jgi:hypothetical protein
MNEEDVLLERFISAFGEFYGLAEYSHIYPIAAELAVGEPDDLGQTPWRPARADTDASCLEPLYAQLPGRFPRLYERLVLTFRWAEVDLGAYTLLANPPGPDLARLFNEISKDPGLWESLIPAGYIQFAKGTEYDYDPVCFDLRNRNKNGDCRVVKIDHKQILCNYRIKVVSELAPSFEELVRQTILRAEKP